jgi:hypothetical protein
VYQDYVRIINNESSLNLRTRTDQVFIHFTSPHRIQSQLQDVALINIAMNKLITLVVVYENEIEDHARKKLMKV